MSHTASETGNRVVDFLCQLNSPLLVSCAGGAVLVALSNLDENTRVLGGWSMGAFQLMNAAAFSINVVSVMIPGRIDGKLASELQAMKQTETLSLPDNGTDKDGHEKNQNLVDIFSSERGRTLVAPSSWAFAIWGPIYLGEAIFCMASPFLSWNGHHQQQLASITIPFVAANLTQSLWCASFRPSYFSKNSRYWSINKFVSVAMLASTAYSLSFLPKKISTFDPTVIGNVALSLPMIVHFGWTTAATLVNLNGSLAATSSVPDWAMVRVGQVSVAVATILGCYVTWTESIPAYGMTIAWALTACASGMAQRQQQQQCMEQSDNTSATNVLSKAVPLQKWLCRLGAIACVVTAVTTMINNK